MTFHAYVGKFKEGASWFLPRGTKIEHNSPPAETPAYSGESGSDIRRSIVNPCRSRAISCGVNSTRGKYSTARMSGSRFPGRFSAVSDSGSTVFSNGKLPIAVRVKADITAAVPSDSAKSRPSERTYVPLPH